jgi:hypothetical protein
MLLRSFGLAVLAAIALTAPAARAGTWLEPQRPFGDAPSRPDEAGVAMGPDGTIVVARLAPDGDVEVRERPPGGPVGETATLEPVGDPPRGFPLQVVVGEYGTAAVLFDAGPERYAALRPPGGRWGRPQEVGPSGPRPAVVAPDGALWTVGEDADDDEALAVTRLAPGGGTDPIPLPDPPEGGRDVSPMITVPSAGEAHVTFQRVIVEAQAGACRRIAVNFTVDVPAHGDPSVPQPLATTRAAGDGPADDCIPRDGLILQAPKLATDDDGADTAVYSALELHSGEAAVLARHRERGEPWGQTESVTDQDVVAETLIGGRGAPAVLLRTGEGESVSTRAGGVWTPPAPLSGRGAVAAPPAARTGAGTVVFAWNEVGSRSERIVGRVLGADGRLGEPTELAPGANAPLLGVGGDDAGDAVVLYSEPEADHSVLQLSGFDGAGPRITAFAVPRTGFAGQGLPLVVEAEDVWSGHATTAAWHFGDGDVADGVAVGHTFAAAGDYTVRVAVPDAAGNATSASRDVAIAPAPDPLPAPTIPPPDRHPPHLKRVAVDPRHPRAGRAATLTLHTDMAGELRVALKHGRRTVKARGLIPAGNVRFKLPRLGAGTWMLSVTEKGVRGDTSRTVRGDTSRSVRGDTSRTVRLRLRVRRAARPRP